ncbi:MAG: KEOPS complex subunit Cgi121 [Candidatus Hadarchaeales archaeon]
MKIHMKEIKVFPIGRKFVAIMSGHLLSPVESLMNQLSDVRSGAVVQALDADSVAGISHVLHAIYLALSGWERGKRFTRRLELEILCYAAADHQISEAIAKVGISSRTKRVVVVSLAESREGALEAIAKISRQVKIRIDFEILKMNPSKQKRLRNLFKISKEEMKAASIEELIMEKIASLSLL